MIGMIIIMEKWHDTLFKISLCQTHNMNLDKLLWTFMNDTYLRSLHFFYFIEKS